MIFTKKNKTINMQIHTHTHTKWLECSGRIKSVQVSVVHIFINGVQSHFKFKVFPTIKKKFSQQSIINGWGGGCGSRRLDLHIVFQDVNSCSTGSSWIQATIYTGATALTTITAHLVVAGNSSARVKTGDLDHVDVDVVRIQSINQTTAITARKLSNWMSLP